MAPDDARNVELVFGGTFDPPHRRHVEMASRAADALGAAAILVIPAALNPQRASALPVAAEDRLALVRIAFAKEPRARVLDLEVRRGPPSYTIDTLEELARLGHTNLRLLIGSDQALNLPTWRAWSEVVRKAPPAIVVRPPHDRESLRQAFAERFDDPETWVGRVLPVSAADLSSTEVRAALAAGDETRVAELLDPEVAQAIRARGLYRR
ncbi:MAG: nicotinate (nicotinamide) nucleotide adenylyltransferase [Phycisphaerae bacterium]|nr:nicotinate (nicotinamide) nucleotide adenylyltransferase [Phycisphaerae bacterium]